MIKLVRGSSQSANTDPLKRGWIAGHMHLKDGGDQLAGSTKFEVKLWHYGSPIDYGKKEFGGTELVVVYGGTLQFNLEFPEGETTSTESILVSGKDEHEYVIFPPGITKEVVVVEGPAYGVTVRWPSGPNRNKIVRK